MIIVTPEYLKKFQSSSLKKFLFFRYCIICLGAKETIHIHVLKLQGN